MNTTSIEASRSYTSTEIARLYGLSTTKFNSILHAWGVLMRMNNTWHTTLEYSHKGLMVQASKKYVRKDRSIGTIFYNKWTEKGRTFVMEILSQEYEMVPR